MLLEVKNVTKRFGGIKALNNVSLSIENPGIYGLIGPNGAGKTTLFKVILGILKPDEGKVIFYGKDITGFPPYKIYKLGVACTFQIVSTFQNLSVFENVKVGCVGGGKFSKGDMDDRIRELLHLVSLSGKEKVLAKNLTLIERKKLDLARALATSPRILLLDEFMSGLNPSELIQVIESIKYIKEKYDLTILLIEHIISAVMKLCEWIFVLSEGELIAEGKPQEIASNEKVIKAYLGEEV
ncbi:MAG: ABC transporter ATP-binding protein [candidate division WOR-3 bacterium]